MSNDRRTSDELIINGGRIVAGVCVVVVAALIVWLCGSTVEQGERISVLERSYQYIQGDLSDLKHYNQKIEAQTRGTNQRLGELLNRLDNASGGDCGYSKGSDQKP